jgi:hypothetical protein
MTNPINTWPGYPYPFAHCPIPHRWPEGPNEDTGPCAGCGSLSWELRPEGQTFGHHDADCALPARHESYCVGGGDGHPPAALIRGYWPDEQQ